MINSSSKENSEGSLSTQLDLNKSQAGSKLDLFLKQCNFFQKLLYLGNRYEVGCNVFVRTQRHQSDCVGKILRIMSYPQTNSTLVPLVEVQWYCSKHEIAEQYKEYFEYFSEYELFLTELTNILFIDCITRSFTVLPLDEFDKLDEVPYDTYFCRAQYDMRKSKLNPGIEDWKKTCVCQKPLNPDLLYIQCERCQTWYHLQCIGLTQQQADIIEQYSCKRCLATL